MGIGGNEPFLIRRGDVLEGITPDIWRVVAEENGFEADLVPQANTASNLAALERGELDLAIGPISITPERLSSGAIEFTQSYFFGQVAALSSIGVLLMSLFVVANLIWLAERRRNPEHFPPHYLHGVGNGLWFAIVTLTTVGYGDRPPVTRLGRVIAGVWMIITLLAVIYDSPALRYYLSQNPQLDLKLAPFSLAQETYGFAMPTDSPLEMPLDVSLLRLLRSGRIEAIHQGWLDGPTDEPGRGAGAG